MHLHKLVLWVSITFSLDFWSMHCSILCNSLYNATIYKHSPKKRSALPTYTMSIINDATTIEMQHSSRIGLLEALKKYLVMWKFKQHIFIYRSLKKPTSGFTATYVPVSVDWSCIKIGPIKYKQSVPNTWRTKIVLKNVTFASVCLKMLFLSFLDSSEKKKKKNLILSSYTHRTEILLIFTNFCISASSRLISFR